MRYLKYPNGRGAIDVLGFYGQNEAIFQILPKERSS